MKKIYLISVLFSSACLLTGCFNMPTQTSQITGVYVSPTKYKDWECEELTTEADNYARRENALVIAQEQRYKNSQTQAFWWGFGQGDGIEATELANVRGEKNALLDAMNRKKCNIPEALTKPIVVEKPKDNREDDIYQ